MALAHCILGKFLGVGCHCFPPPLDKFLSVVCHCFFPHLDVPTFSARCLHVQRRERTLAAEGGTFRRREMFRNISSRIRLPRNSRYLLHAANLRHGTDGFTSPPKEDMRRKFFSLKNPTTSGGFEPANLGTKGQHATTRPPKMILAICIILLCIIYKKTEINIYNRDCKVLNISVCISIFVLQCAFLSISSSISPYHRTRNPMDEFT
jgi:hypothetical protein